MGVHPHCSLSSKGVRVYDLSVVQCFNTYIAAEPDFLRDDGNGQQDAAAPYQICVPGPDGVAE
eukprot:1944014-Pyramimonas_sp.AAC.1